jgi:hypothetical protein
MILRTYQILENVFQENVFRWKHFPTLGTWLGPPDFLFMTNTEKCLLRNHFWGKCFPSKIFFNKSRAGPKWIPIKFRASPNKVPIKSRASPDRVPDKSEAGHRRVPIKSQVSPRGVPGKSKPVSAGFGRVPGGSWSSLGRILLGSWQSPGQVSNRLGCVPAGS